LISDKEHLSFIKKFWGFEWFNKNNGLARIFVMIMMLMREYLYCINNLLIFMMIFFMNCFIVTIKLVFNVFCFKFFNDKKSVVFEFFYFSKKYDSLNSETYLTSFMCFLQCMLKFQWVNCIWCFHRTTNQKVLGEEGLVFSE